MYKGLKTKRNMSVHEFLCLIRRNCQKGCSNCLLREEDIEPSIQKKLCVFSKFDILSDKSLLLILQKSKEISDFRF